MSTEPTNTKIISLQTFLHIFRFTVVLFSWTYLGLVTIDVVSTQLGIIFEFSHSNIWWIDFFLKKCWIIFISLLLFKKQALIERQSPFWTGFAIYIIYIIPLFLLGPRLVIPIVALIYVIATFSAEGIKQKTQEHFSFDRNKIKKITVIFLFLMFITTIGINSFLKTTIKSRSPVENASVFYDYHKYQQAFMFAQMAAAGGNAKATFLLWKMYSLGHGVPEDTQKGYSLLQRAADLGEPKAAFELGDAYQYGLMGFPVNYVKAAFYYQKSKSAFSLSNLAILYAKGLGVEKNENKAHQLMLMAANLGDGVAMYNIGLVYENKIQIPDHYKIAADWFKKSIQHPTDVNPCAPNDLGMLYASGKGVEKDAFKAKVKLMNAADVVYYHLLPENYLKNMTSYNSHEETLQAFVDYQSAQANKVNNDDVLAKKYSPLALKTAKEIARLIADTCWK